MMILKNIKKSIIFFRLFGIILTIIALLGYCFVADEFRHIGEFLGVTSILIAGIILLIKDSKFDLFRNFAIQWVSFCLLICIPIGGLLLDNMPLGLVIGLAFGILLAYIFRKPKVHDQ